MNTPKHASTLLVQNDEFHNEGIYSSTPAGSHGWISKKKAIALIDSGNVNVPACQLERITHFLRLTGEQQESIGCGFVTVFED